MAGSQFQKAKVIASLTGVDGSWVEIYDYAPESMRRFSGGIVDTIKYTLLPEKHGIEGRYFRLVVYETFGDLTHVGIREWTLYGYKTTDYPYLRIDDWNLTGHKESEYNSFEKGTISINNNDVINNKPFNLSNGSYILKYSTK